ncbi:MAG: primosomal protein N' [Candidatus Melainabacteria bacterium]|nr:primosomal protein N' [Candidatus Melainabacteria bacterium]
MSVNSILENNVSLETKVPTLIAKVAIDLPYSYNDFFYYSIPEELKNEIKPGLIVKVPFGKKELIGYVLEILTDKEQKNNTSEFKIKPIYQIVFKDPVWDKNFLVLAKWISKYYLTNIGIVLSSSIISEILSQLKKHSALSTQHSALNAQHSALNAQLQPPTLNPAQQNAFNVILKTIQNKESNVFLLHGVTGSGKTEVYLKLIEEVLKENKTIIYLVPEIYLVPQTYERLKNRFSNSEIIIWHSSLSKKERLENWTKLKEANIILGARSAILAPVKNIGLIIIDEAHEAAYKQSLALPRYDTKQVAIKRSQIEKCPLILGSATPNITDYYNCLQKQTILELPERIENVPMPRVYVIDLKNEFPRTNKNIISKILENNINEALSKNEQAILLLNRRGYSSHVFCRACGFIQYCKNCSVPLVFHKNLQSIICHHCGYKKSFTTYGNEHPQCPNCKSPHFTYFGLGTQQLEEETKRIFKDAKTIRVDSDQLKRKNEYINLWQEFSSGKADILIGTQLVAKGIDLPNVTVVGVILADTMLNFPDYISYERAFQLLTQVTGRAGRGQKPGKVFIQTYQIENQLFKYIQEHDFHGFYNTEIKQREQFLYPPFTSLTRIIFQSKDEDACKNYANEVLNELSALSSQLSAPTLHLLGPAPCFFTKLHGKYRYHILCKTTNEETKSFLFNNLLQKLNKNAKVGMIVDMDSINLL